MVAGAVVAFLGVVGTLVFTTGGETAAGVVVFTQVPAGATNIPGSDGAAQRYPAESRIVSFALLEPERSVRVLTEEFHSARAPALSPDGSRMAFSGQREDGGPWQIWEMELRRRRPRLIAPVEGATDPAYLADGRIVFSAPADGNTTEAGHALFTAGLGDTDPMRISFHPRDDSSPTVLRDGRLLFVTHESPGARDSRLMTMRADGTAAELFYEDRNGGRQDGRAWETPDDRVLFVESADPEAPGGRLIAVSEHRPLHSRVELGSGMEGAFHSVAPLSLDEILVSYRPNAARRYGLYTFAPLSRRLVPMLDPDPGYDAIEPVVAVTRPAPKRFESVVDLQRATGELYCLDADHSDLPVDRAPGSSSSSASVRIHSAEGTLGEVQLEEDGSFYIEVPADTPLQLETLDAEGRVVRGPSAWIWVRPNERRGCIGCHEDRELAPENRVPRAVEKPPVALPAVAPAVAAPAVVAPAAAGGGTRESEAGVP
jgi:hypothetical protein